MATAINRPSKKLPRVRLIGSGPHVDQKSEDFILKLSEESGRSIGEVIDFLVNFAKGPVVLDRYYVSVTIAEFMETTGMHVQDASRILKALSSSKRIAQPKE